MYQWVIKKKLLIKSKPFREDTSNGRRLKYEWYLQNKMRGTEKPSHIAHRTRIHWNVVWKCIVVDGKAVIGIVVFFFYCIHPFEKVCIFWKMLFILHDKRWKRNLLLHQHMIFFAFRNYNLLYFAHICDTCQISTNRYIFSRKYFFWEEFRHYINKFFKRNTSKVTAKQIVRCIYHICKRLSDQRKPCIQAWKS